jgi:hypothetical protein
MTPRLKAHFARNTTHYVFPEYFQSLRGCELPGADMQKRYAPKYEQGKTKIDLFRDFLQKSPMSKL